MARVKGGYVRSRRHNKIKKEARGFKGHRRRTVKGAQEGILHALANAYISRKQKKRNMRSLWIVRINAALRPKGLSYSKFISMLKGKNVVLNRKVMSDLAIADPKTLDKIIDQVAS
ncbi:50S ribosomal protein L20 [candidate division WWE3 bacterium]|uniref:Large ribosomal subunit protein bL20 n=1 Tax=candidate division WWE3 bacterium TaxID=2053526 RepID=A0A955LKF4_UNCKA|nr:50S ribosomal protein L20 [candidate division WWE3 bacterium]